MRRSTLQPTTPTRTIAHWVCVLLCVGCGGKRFQSEPDAGDNEPSSQDSNASAIQPDPSNAVQTSEPFISMDEPSDCDGGTGCNNSGPTNDSGQTLGPSSETITEETTDVVEGDAGDPETTADVDAAPGDETAEVSTSCGLDCATSSWAVTGTIVTTTSEPSSSDTTVPEETSTEPADECPDDEAQVVQGSCGCGFAPSVDCETLADHLVHRYTFDGTGTQLTDIVGDAHGNLHNCELTDTSQLEFDGEGCYVALPSGMLSAYSDATLKSGCVGTAVTTTNASSTSALTENEGDTPSSYISLSPRAGNDDALTLSYLADPDDSSESLRTDYALDTGSVQHLAVVVDSTFGYLSLYQGDQLQTDSETAQNLADLEDSSVWLGRALYSDYPYFRGELLEFRIYDTALGDSELAQSDELGPDADFSAVE